MKKRTKYIWIITLVVCLGILLISLLSLTGFLQRDNIDERDLERWQYENGLMKNTAEFSIEGNKETCWLMIHGFTGSPFGMKELAERINNKFGDFVYATRLRGHGEVPSHIVNLTLDDWYLQVEQDFNELEKNCNHINVVGFSFGGALAARLSTEKQIKNTYLIAPYIFARYKIIRIFKLEDYLYLFGDILIYSKKTKIAQINDPEGRERYISYWNFPFAPVANSQPFLINLEEKLSKINNPILIQHSENDNTADIESSKLIYNQASSSEKELIVFENSSHVLLFDYDRESVIQNILNFETINR